VYKAVDSFETVNLNYAAGRGIPEGSSPQGFCWSSFVDSVRNLATDACTKVCSKMIRQNVEGGLPSVAENRRMTEFVRFVSFVSFLINRFTAL
jgi:hypothetical protein